ncbi:MAG: PD40 domain-containing protein [Planctomycetes bacterium]|nr:PD40 domain-containing protein [Planctomycetota bacterium]
MSCRSFLRFSIVSCSLLGVVRAQDTTRISITYDGAQPDLGSRHPALSADGRFVAFESDATNMVPGDTNDDCAFGSNCTDIFVYDRQTALVERVSVNSAGAQARNGDCILPSLSADGRFVTFSSYADNLVPGDRNQDHDVFVRDRLTGTTSRVSVAYDGSESNGYSDGGSIAADGRYVAFASHATNIVPGDTNAAVDAFTIDRETNSVERVDVDSSGVASTFGGFNPAISPDGRFVVFASDGNDLAAGDTNGRIDIYVRDRELGRTERISIRPDGGEFQINSLYATISANDRFVAFLTVEPNTAPCLYVRDRVAESTQFVRCVSSTDGGLTISGDGRFVCAGADIYDRETTFRLIFGRGRDGASTGSGWTSLSGDGHLIAFESALQLTPDDREQLLDIYVEEVRDPLECAGGNVNAAGGTIANVLAVNGSSGVVIAAVAEPITVALAASPSGPTPTPYALWVWRTGPTRALDVVLNGEVIGCALNATPLSSAPGYPTAYRCLVGGLGVEFSGSVRTLSISPPAAPWSLTRGRGFLRTTAFTLQGVIADDGASNSQHLSMSNAVVLLIR